MDNFYGEPIGHIAAGVGNPNAVSKMEVWMCLLPVCNGARDHSYCPANSHERACTVFEEGYARMANIQVCNGNVSNIGIDTGFCTQIGAVVEAAAGSPVGIDALEEGNGDTAVLRDLAARTSEALDYFSGEFSRFVLAGEIAADFERISAALGEQACDLVPIEAIDYAEVAYDALEVLGRLGFMNNSRQEPVQPYEAEVRRLACFFDERRAQEPSGSRSRRRGKMKRRCTVTCQSNCYDAFAADFMEPKF